MTPSFKSSGTIVQIVQQAYGHEIVAVQVNVVPVGPADEGNMDLVASAALSTFNEYETTMNKTEIISALRYVADQLEAQER